MEWVLSILTFSYERKEPYCFVAVVKNNKVVGLTVEMCVFFRAVSDVIQHRFLKYR